MISLQQDFNSTSESTSNSTSSSTDNFTSKEKLILGLIRNLIKKRY